MVLWQISRLAGAQGGPPVPPGDSFVHWPEAIVTWCDLMWAGHCVGGDDCDNCSLCHAQAAQTIRLQTPATDNSWQSQFFKQQQKSD